MIKETAVFTCDICNKQETYVPEGNLVSYPVKGWYFGHKLEWNKHHSTPLDFCEACFDSAFYNNDKAEQKKSAASIWKRFFQRKSNDQK